MFVYNSVSFFSHIIEPNFEIADKDLLNNFLSAIDTFAKDIYKSNLNSINLGNYTLMLSKVPLQDVSKENFTIICFMDKNENEKQIREYIELFQHGFLRIFSPQEIIAWDGNILKFLPFKKIINRILNVPPGLQIRDVDIEPELEKQYQVHESVLFGIIDQNKAILDGYTYSKESEIQISMPQIIEKIAGNISLNTHRWEGIIPFLDEKQIALILLVQTDDSRILTHFSKSEPLFLLVVYTVPETFQVDFSRSAGLISQSIKDNCLKVLDNKYIENWTLIFEQIKDQLNNHLIESSPIRRIDTAEKDVASLIDFGKIKNVEILCHALITRGPVAIAGGSPDFARRIMHQCLFFTIHRPMSIIEYSKDSVDPNKVNIVLISEKDVKKFKDFIIVDLEKIYFNEANKKNWKGIASGLMLYSIHWLCEIINALIQHFSGHALWTIPKGTSYLLLIGVGIELSLMFSIAGLAQSKVLPDDPSIKILGLPNRFVIGLGNAALASIIEIFLVTTPTFIWIWQWWNAFTVFIFVYIPFFVISAYAYDWRPKKQINVLGTLIVINIILLIVFAGFLHWI